MTDIFAQAVQADPSSTSITLVSALIAAIVSLASVIAWFGRTFVAGISQYRSDILAYKASLAKALELANDTIEKVREDSASELKEERKTYLTELEKRDVVISKLSSVVEKLVGEVSQLGKLFSNQFEQGYAQMRDQRNARD